MPIKPTVLMAGTTGLNNVVDSRRLRTGDDGLVELAATKNIDIDDSFRPATRAGTTLVASGHFHSLHKNGEEYFGVRDDVLVAFDTFLTFTSIVAASDSTMYYANVGNRTYFSNDLQLGYVVDKVLYPWMLDDHVEPNTTTAYSGPPRGRFLEHLNGVLFTAVGNVVFHCVPFHPGLWNLADAYIPFATDIRMIKGAGKVLYISDSSSVYVHELTEVGWGKRKVFDAPAVSGTARSVVNFQDLGDGFLFATPKGICFAGNNGAVKNMTDGKVVVPNATAGTAFTTQTHYVSISQ